MRYADCHAALLFLTPIIRLIIEAIEGWLAYKTRTIDPLDYSIKSYACCSPRAFYLLL